MNIAEYKLRRYKRLIARMDGEWEESDHPRDSDGKFSSGGSSTGSRFSRFGKSKAKSSTATKTEPPKKKSENFQKYREMIENGEIDSESASKMAKELPKSEFYELLKLSTPKNKESKNEVTPAKQSQFELIQNTNPMRDNIHTGVRKASDIKTFDEAFAESPSYPDITPELISRARKTGKITIYSSKNIKGGTFVTPSKSMAKDYAGGGRVNSMEVDINDIAWINSDEGQYAPVKKKG